jgi:hypothetical protein
MALPKTSLTEACSRSCTESRMRPIAPFGRLYGAVLDKHLFMQSS